MPVEEVLAEVVVPEPPVPEQPVPVVAFDELQRAASKK